MEKINTPLMALIEELKLERLALLKLMQPAGQYDRAIYIAESILPAEHDMIEKAFDESRLTHPMLGFKHETFEEYFNETFKSYE